MSTNNPEATRPRQRIEMLDGMRGVAAILVVLYHLIETYQGASIHIINHAYLAVDFFFILSGFVLSYAYDSLWVPGFKRTAFYKRRLTRLHPMVVFATIMGALLYYFQKSPAFPLIEQTKFLQLLRATVMGILCIPSTSGLDIRGWQEMYCLNSPQWTLAWEYVAMLLYAIVLRKLSNKHLFLVTCIAALLTINLSLNINVLGILQRPESLDYTVIGGWCLNRTELFIGFSRLLFPFCCGMLIQRTHKKIGVRNAFAFATLILIGLFFVPRLPGIYNGIFETLCILAVFPLLIMTGNGSIQGASGEKENSRGLCHVLGQLSFPLYITHFPIVYLQAAWVSFHPNASFGMNFLITSTCFVCMLAIASLAHRFVEKPAKRWLSTLWVKSEPL